MNSVPLCVLCGDDVTISATEFTEAVQITNLAHRGQG
jgi:hypothetical protein